MTDPKTTAEIETTQYGFKYGAATVTRYADFDDGTVAIGIEGAGDNKVTVYASPKGQSVRVFRGGKELKAVAQ